MLKPAPNVYVPIEPDANGVGLPTILSLVVHGGILAFIIFTHHIPEIETPTPIETTIITPEELSEMQSEVIANRQALSEAEAVDSINNDSIPNDMQFENSPPVRSRDITKGTTSIFTRSSRTPDIPSPKIKPEKVQDYGYDEVEEPLIDKVEDSPKGGDYSTNENPGRGVNETIVPNVDGSGSDGQPSSGSSLTDSDIQGQISNMVYTKWTPPRNQKGRKVTASVTVDENGNVKNVKGKSSDSVLNLSIESAVRSASPLTPLIGTGKRSIKLVFVVE